MTIALLIFILLAVTPAEPVAPLTTLVVFVVMGALFAWGWKVTKP